MKRERSSLYRLPFSAFLILFSMQVGQVRTY